MLHLKFEPTLSGQQHQWRQYSVVKKSESGIAWNSPDGEGETARKAQLKSMVFTHYLTQKFTPPSISPQVNRGISLLFHWYWWPLNFWHDWYRVIKDTSHPTALIECNHQTWRDMQHIVVEGVRPIEELATNVEWTVNGVGKLHSQ